MKKPLMKHVHTKKMHFRRHKCPRVLINSDSGERKKWRHTHAAPRTTRVLSCSARPESVFTDSAESREPRGLLPAAVGLESLGVPQSMSCPKRLCLLPRKASGRLEELIARGGGAEVLTWLDRRVEGRAVRAVGPAAASGVQAQGRLSFKRRAAR